MGRTNQTPQPPNQPPAAAEKESSAKPPNKLRLAVSKPRKKYGQAAAKKEASRSCNETFSQAYYIHWTRTHCTRCFIRTKFHQHQHCCKLVFILFDLCLDTTRQECSQQDSVYWCFVIAAYRGRKPESWSNQTTKYCFKLKQYFMLCLRQPSVVDYFYRRDADTLII